MSPAPQGQPPPAFRSLRRLRTHLHCPCFGLTSATGATQLPHQVALSPAKEPSSTLPGPTPHPPAPWLQRSRCRSEGSVTCTVRPSCHADRGPESPWSHCLYFSPRPPILCADGTASVPSGSPPGQCRPLDRHSPLSCGSALRQHPRGPAHGQSPQVLPTFHTSSFPCRQSHVPVTLSWGSRSPSTLPQPLCTPHAPES